MSPRLTSAAGPLLQITETAWASVIQRKAAGHLRAVLEKVQAQSRATVSALVDLKYPRHATFAKQVNIAHGPQKVSNGAAPPSETSTGSDAAKSGVKLFADCVPKWSNLSRNTPAMSTADFVKREMRPELTGSPQGRLHLG